MGKDKKEGEKSKDKSKDKDKDKKAKSKDKVKDKEPGSPSTTSNTSSTTKKNWNILIIDSDDKDWHPFFEGKTTTSGRGITIEKTRWENMMISATSAGECIVNMRPNKSPKPGTNEGQFRTFQPNFVLVRKLVRGLTGDEDYSSNLFGLMYAGLPSVNSLESVHRCLERPVLYAALNGIKQRLGQDKFPLIKQHYYSQQNTMMFTPEFPIVVGYAQAGFGKMLFKSSDDGFSDFKGVLALHKDYVTAEPFIPDRECDLRIQKIGDHYRVYKRVSSNWKGNVGSSVIEEIPVTDTYKMWAEECGKLFGGMDILTVDAIRTKDGKEYILEINDTASGLYGPNEKEDMGYICDLIMSRLNDLEASKQE